MSFTGAGPTAQATPAPPSVAPVTLADYWTVVGGDVVAAAESGAPETAAAPLALAENMIVPAPDTVQVKT
jgi:hypothetical protein